MSTLLFDKFEPSTAAEWKQQIQFELQGKNYNDTLVWNSLETISVKPFYTKEDAKDSLFINLPTQGFLVCQSIFIDDENKANSIARKATINGAKAIQFIANKKFSIEVLLRDLLSNEVTLYFKFNFLDLKFIEILKETSKNINIYLQIDPIGKLVSTGNWFQESNDNFKELQKIVSQHSNSLHVDASLYQNAGASMTQQLAYALAHTNEYFEKLGAKFYSKVHYTFSVGSNYFFEIAKLRAFRALFDALLKEHGISNHDPIHILVIPTLRNKTIYDYNVNMLRTTSECMSAILGGANTIANVSYDEIFHKSNEFGDRIARNQLTILQQESYLNEAQSIANGCYYIEKITKQLANNALELFKSIEQAGGILKQLKEGTIQRKINESASVEQKLFDEDKITLLGTNMLINPKDRMKNDLEIYPFLKQNPAKTIIQPILSKRLSENLEKHRLDKE